MNTSKPLFGIVLAIAFTALGAYLINKSQGSENGTLLLIIGIACVVFFGGLLILNVFRLMKK